MAKASISIIGRLRESPQHQKPAIADGWPDDLREVLDQLVDEMDSGKLQCSLARAHEEFSVELTERKLRAICFSTFRNYFMRRRREMQCRK